MRLFSRTNATAIDDPEHGHFEAAENGAFDLPDVLAAKIRGFAVRGERLWEDDIERQHRQIAEEIERQKDPATLLAAVNKLVEAAKALPAPAEAAPAKAKTAAKAATAE